MLRSTSEIAHNLAPHGALRVALNLGNRALVQADPVTHEIFGVSVDLARGLARELELNVEFVSFRSALEVIAAVDGDQWDVAFLAINPARLERLQFTQPYAAIAGVEQAMATPKGRTLGWAYLASYIERMRACNFVAQSLARSGQDDMLDPV